MKEHKIKQIVILGGGSAGWLTAGRIAAERGADVQVTLIESPDIPSIGVGEGTWPSMRVTLQKIGISENQLFQECDAAFKQGAKFARWVNGSEDDFYYHPLVLPHGFREADLASAWLSSKSQSSKNQTSEKQVPFADAVCCQSHLCEHGLAPKQIGTPEYASVANYAYHLDAVKLGKLLQKHCTEKLGVHHILDTVIQVHSKEDGDIAALETRANGKVAGDLFVDCSGLQSVLLGQHYKIPFESKKDTLFNDTAIAMQIPYSEEQSPIACHTVSTAHEAGWIWDIGLPTRKGVGIVYASDYMDSERAEMRLREYAAVSLGMDKVEQISSRKIDISPGHRQTFWHRNCVAIGLSAGFLEPLEASALVLVESSASILAEELPANRKVMDTIAKRFNKRLHYYWDTIVDFLKLHYVLSQRTDSDYWLAHRKPETASDRLNESLDLWRTQIPNKYDFPLTEEMFPAASWQYVMYGMGFESQLQKSQLQKDKLDTALDFMVESRELTRRYLQVLPDHRVLIEKIRQYGMPKM